MVKIWLSLVCLSVSKHDLVLAGFPRLGSGFNHINRNSDLLTSRKHYRSIFESSQKVKRFFSCLRVHFEAASLRHPSGRTLLRGRRLLGGEFGETGTRYPRICPQEGAVYLISHRVAVLPAHHKVAQQHHLVNLTELSEMTSRVNSWIFPTIHFLHVQL